MLKTLQRIITIFTIQTLLFSAISYANPLHIKTKVPHVLSVISYSEFAPISYGQNGQGYEGDLLRAIAKLWNIKIKFYPEPVYEGLWLLPSKSYTKADISMGGTTPLDYRIKQGALFSNPTAHYKQSLLVRKNDYLSGRISSYKSFANTHLKIGVVPGTSGETFARFRAKEANLPSSTLVQYDSESDLLPALLNGKIDAIARGEIGNNYQETINKKLKVIAKKNFGDKFAFAIDKSNPILTQQLNQAIKQITNNGKIGYVQWLQNPDVFLERANQLIKS